MPNPFNESAVVILTGAEDLQSHEPGSYRMKIYDVLGNEMRSIHFAGKETTVARRDLSDGIYFYKIILLDGKIVSGKFVVAKL